MPFFDFHCHPGLKPTFSNQGTAPSVWQFISAKLAVFDNVHISINPLFNEVLNSQSCLSQLFNGNIKLFGLALHSPEAAMAEGLLQKKLVNKGAIALLDSKRLELIRDGKHYFQFLNDDLNRVINTPSPQNLNGAKLKVLKSSADFNEADQNTICAFIVVEGLHCFFGDQGNADVNQYQQNFEKFTDENTVLAINICHIQQAGFCNHAYGIQFISDKRFLPSGNGITDSGMKMINRIIEKKILTDIKHMSLRSRRQLYDKLRDENDENKYKAPIICTHAGLTGQSIRDRVKFLFKSPIDIGDVYEVVYLKPESPYIKNVYFNCSSINLYDEDIETILLSDGLIGLSFDQRILGFTDENVLREVTTPNDVEYISEQEASFFLGPNPTGLPPWNDFSKIWASEQFADLEPALNEMLHPMFFFNQVLHILTVAKNHPLIGVQKALNKICLGSDFDGLINAIDNCKQVDKLETFKNLMISKMPKLLNDAGLGNEGINVQQLADNIFYNNGKNFVINRLKAIGK